jgi:hypothetical protein
MEDDINDRYDPDRWMALGKNLCDFRSGGQEADLFYAAHPELGQRVARWRSIMADTVHKAWKERNEPVSEEELREMWRSITTKPPQKLR